MATYQELKAQAEKLLAQAEELRRQEVTQAIADIRQKTEAYGLGPQDLGFTKPASKSHKTKSTAPIKYRGPDGQGWSGGRGRKPDWVIKALTEGKSLDDFRV